jgi:hypothetical protein
MKISPLGYSYITTNNESVNPSFTIKNENFAFCKTSCNIILKDISNDALLFNDSIILSHGEEKEYSFTINGTDKGSGQKIFRVSNECHNIKSTICFTTEEKRYKAVVIINNYNLKDYEEDLKNVTKEELENYNSEFLSYNSSLENLKENIDLIPNNAIEKRDLSKLLNNISNKINSTEQVINQNLELWKNEEFEKLNTEEINKYLLLIKNETSLFEVKLENYVNLYNQLSDNLTELKNKKQEVNDLVNYLYDNSNEVNDIILTDLKDLTIKINNLMKNILVTNYSIVDYNLKISNYMDQLDVLLYNYRYRNDLKNYYFYMYSQLLTYKNSSMIFDDDSIDCDLLKELSNEINISNEYGMTNETITIFSDNLSNEINSGFEKRYEDIIIDDIKIESNLFEFAIYDNSTLIIITNSLLNDFIDGYCGVQLFSNKSFLSEINIFEKIIVPYSNYTYYDFSLDNNTAKCCIFNSCNKCVENPNMDYPILFIHGHSMNEKNSLDYSMQAFAKIQKKLEEEGYMNMGEFRPNDYYNLEVNDWGYINAPISIRASYYFTPYTLLGDYKISVEKSEKIENYAIRLHETIDLIKKKTGKEKVNIIAHSMGGLVLRQYGALFGYNSIDKVITINTPYNGISDNVKKYCSFFGAAKECDDMAEGSVFLSKLKTNPLPLSIFVIRSTGCDMGKESGDGIVTNSSGYLKGATNYEIKGGCTDNLQTDLHTNVLDIDKYPETYDLIIQILGET